MVNVVIYDCHGVGMVLLNLALPLRGSKPLPCPLQHPVSGLGGELKAKKVKIMS